LAAKFLSSVFYVFNFLQVGYNSGRWDAEAVAMAADSYVNVQEKAETYKDEALQNLFLMNNLNYVVTSMQSYGSSKLLPEDWVSRHRALVATYRVGYLKVGVSGRGVEGCCVVVGVVLYLECSLMYRSRPEV
jgi:hypothetical protein